MATRIPLSSPEALQILSTVRVVYTDLDGTLLAPGGHLLADMHGQPYLGLAEAIMDLNEASIDIVPISGRNRIQLGELARLLNFKSYFAEMGSVAVYGQGSQARIRYDLGVWPEEATADGSTPYQLIEAMGAVNKLQQAFPGAIEPHVPWTGNREVTSILRGNIDVSVAEDILADLPLPVKVLDNGIIHPPKHDLAVDAPIHAYHLLPKGISKSAALKRDLVRRGITPAATIAIGDSYADIAMGEATGAFAVMSSALESQQVQDALSEFTGSVLVTSFPSPDGWVEFAQALLRSR